MTTATDARGLPHEHLFVLGLSEGVFPLELSEDAFYLDSEREVFSDRGVLLETQSERSDDDGLFYELISLPNQTLTLSRPTIHDGKIWIASHLWRSVRSVFHNLEPHVMRIGDVVPTDDVASLDEAVLAVADGLGNHAADVVRLQHWLTQTQPRYWGHIRHGRAIEMQRLSRLPHDAYSGRLTDFDLIQRVAEQLGSQRLWSASQLNDYGLCGFRFFAKRLLKLEAIDEPEIGLNALQLGSINHAILEETYQQLRAHGVVIDPHSDEYEANLDLALEILDSCATTIFDCAPQDFAFRESAQWEQEQQVILRRLEALVRADFAAEGPLKHYGVRDPFAFEMAFGLKQRPPAIIPLDEVGEIKVRGMIDRIDRVGEDEALVIDYKTGSRNYSVRLLETGQNFQMMVYLEAAQQLLQRQALKVKAGAFWSVRTQKTSGEMVTGDEKTEAAIEQGRRHLARNIHAGRRGDFSVEPTKLDDGKCSSYCEFHQLCRVAIVHRAKQRSDG